MTRALSGQREASTRARVVQELLETPAVQELVRAHLREEPDRVGALEAAVRTDPELAMGVALAAVDRVNDAVRSLGALIDLLAGLPAPLVREVLKDSWGKLDTEAFSQVWSSVSVLANSEGVDWRAVKGWTADRLDGAFKRIVDRNGLESRLLRQSVRIALEAYERALQREPRLIEKVVDDALEGVERDVVEHTLDSSLEQVANLLAARPYMLRSLGRFALRVARGSVRASWRR